MFNSNASIKFMMAKIFFNLANFSFKKIDEVTPVTSHGSDTIEVNFIRNGKGMVKINDSEYEVQSGSYIIIPEFVSYSIIPIEPIDIYSAYLLIDNKAGFKNYVPLLKEKYIGNLIELKYDFDELCDELKRLDFGYNEIATSLFKKIIVKILRNEKINEERVSYYKIESLQYDIENIINNEFSTITLDDLANRLHIGTRELQRYLLKNYKKSFNELKTESRMNYSANKLIYTDIKISELYEDVGYSAPEHFSLAFKKYFNMSPNEYRKKNKKHQ